MARLLPAVLLVSAVGCGPDLFDELAKVPVCDEQGGTDAICASLLSSSGETSGSTTVDTDGLDVTTTGGVQTVTGASEDTGDPATDPSTTAGPPQDKPPTIELFTVTPAHLDEAGSVELQLHASDDVVAVRLSLDGEYLAVLTPADFPRTWDALSAKDNGLARTFEVVVEDAGGLTAAAMTTLGVQVPASGVERCLFEDPDKGAVTSTISALKYTREAILAVGARDTGAGFRMTVWALDPDHCEVALPGWPKTITGWSGDDEFNKVASVGVAIDVDAHGNIVVGGNLLVGDQPQSYVVLLNSGGSRLWQHAGLVGDEVTSVAAATGQYKDRVFVGGARRTSKIPVRTDAAIWVYQSTGETVFVAPPELLAAPFTREEADDEKNERSEQVHAIVLQPGSGNALVVGEREFKDDDDFVYSRTFTAQIHALGGIVGAPWTSWAPSLKHDAARALTLCGDDILAGGWTRDVPADAKPQPIMFWIEEDGSSVKQRDEPQLGSTQIHGIACDREAKIVSAGTRDALERDAHVFTVPGQNGPRTMYELGVPGEDGAGTVACDPRGFCGWGGYRTANGKPYAVVRVHHP